MPGRVHDPQQQRAEVDLLAVTQATEREEHVRRLVQAELGAGRGGQLAVAGDVIGMEVRVDHQPDAVAALLGEVEVRLDVVGRIDDHRLAGLSRRDEVGGAAEVVVQELLEVHGPGLPVEVTIRRWTARGRRPRRSRRFPPTVQNSRVTDKTLSAYSPRGVPNGTSWGVMKRPEPALSDVVARSVTIVVEAKGWPRSQRDAWSRLQGATRRSAGSSPARRGPERAGDEPPR